MSLLLTFDPAGSDIDRQLFGCNFRGPARTRTGWLPSLRTSPYRPRLLGPLVSPFLSL